MNIQLTHDEVIDLMKQIKASGYAVAVFTPQELKDIPPEDIEDAMIVAGNQLIDWESEHD